MQLSFVSAEQLPRDGIAVIGIAHDQNSSFMRGPAGAPPLIRRAMHCGSANLTTELGVDIGERGGWGYLPDLHPGTEPEASRCITETARNLLTGGLRIVSLGGDHAITFPVMRAYAENIRNMTIVHVDAHPDLYDELDGNRMSHACPFARIMESKLATRLIQIGVRSLNREQRRQAERFGVEIFHARSWALEKLPRIDGPIYLSIDLDGLDPAFAPGVSHHEPGGLSSRQVFSIIQALPATIVGADIVEYNPDRDLLDMTAMLAAKLLKEVLGRMLAQSG